MENILAKCRIEEKLISEGIFKRIKGQSVKLSDIVISSLNISKPRVLLRAGCGANFL
jgi:hypothetical protein